MIMFNYHGINFEVSEDSVEGRCAKAFALVDEYVEAVKSGVAYKELPNFDYRVIYDLVDETWDSPLHEVVWDKYNLYNWASDKAYRDYAEADFLAFERKNVDYERGLWIGSEEDYNSYSDWSKDIYGRRRRWTVASRL